jgi:hypothetical protein
MKAIVGNYLSSSYIFDASAKTVTISWIDNFNTNSLLAIINNTTWDIIFQPNLSWKLATIVWDIITLQYDTSFMSDTDILQIFIEIDWNIKITNPDWSNINSPSTNYLVAWIDWDHIWYFEPWTDLWYIRKINTDWITYANISNNPTYTTYATAWADKASLTYDLSITF